MPVPHHSIFTGQMLFLTPKQQCQSTESKRNNNKFSLNYSVRNPRKYPVPYSRTKRYQLFLNFIRSDPLPKQYMSIGVVEGERRDPDIFGDAVPRKDFRARRTVIQYMRSLRRVSQGH